MMSNKHLNGNSVEPLKSLGFDYRPEKLRLPAYVCVLFSAKEKLFDTTQMQEWVFYPHNVAHTPCAFSSCVFIISAVRTALWELKFNKVCK